MTDVPYVTVATREKNRLTEALVLGNSHESQYTVFEDIGSDVIGVYGPRQLTV